jgi:hypothetical protein
MTKRTAKILGLLDKQNNIRQCAEGEKSQYSQERWAFLLDADFPPDVDSSYALAPPS